MHTEIVFDSSSIKELLLCLGIKNCIFWCREFLTRWENVHCENCKMDHKSQYIHLDPGKT